MAEISQVERIPDIGDEPEIEDPLTEDFFKHRIELDNNISYISQKFLTYLEKKPTNLINLARIHKFLINQLRRSLTYTFWITVFRKFKRYLKNHKLDGSKISWYNITPSLRHKSFVDKYTETGISLYYHLVANDMISKYDDNDNKFRSKLSSVTGKLEYDFDHFVYDEPKTTGGKNFISKLRKNKKSQNKKKKKSKPKTRRKSRKHR